MFLFYSCEFYIESTKGEGEIESKTLNIDKFSGVNINFACDVIISQGESQEVKLTGHANIIDKILTKVSNNKS